jgi:antitoxin PrlF
MGMPITTKGQVTIPKPMRDHLGLAPGSRVEFELDAEGRVVLRKADALASPVESRFARARFATKGRNDLTTEEIMKLTRGEDWGDAG